VFDACGPFRGLVKRLVWNLQEGKQASRSDSATEASTMHQNLCLAYFDYLSCALQPHVLMLQDIRGRHEEESLRLPVALLLSITMRSESSKLIAVVYKIWHILLLVVLTITIHHHNIPCFLTQVQQEQARIRHPVPYLQCLYLQETPVATRATRLIVPT
jgi:hypothetical protein